ncbi:unnamed protein product [Strongylus vulgaris]|uniref:G-protein coupled receptors family 1 profile domain-containing protein n=1 Tax=Strongylus vulgaris TaxID=40348 RepID=A0A3P7JU76_STRVU|nr:unnamed protein product [Strongylus vulgaris]
MSVEFPLNDHGILEQKSFWMIFALRLILLLSHARPMKRHFVSLYNLSDLKTALLATKIFAETTILVFGFVGNLCSCFVIGFDKSMHTSTNYYLISLAISDLLTVCLGESVALS